MFIAPCCGLMWRIEIDSDELISFFCGVGGRREVCVVPDGYSRPRHMSGRGPLAGRSLCGRARQWEGRSGARQRGTEPSGTTQTSRLPLPPRMRLKHRNGFVWRLLKKVLLFHAHENGLIEDSPEISFPSSNFRFSGGSFMLILDSIRTILPFLAVFSRFCSSS